MDPHLSRHLRQSDAVGVALVIVVAWISSITSHQRFYTIPNCRNATISTRIQIARVVAIAVAAVLRFCALGQTRLVLVAVTYATAVAMITATRSAREHPADFPHSLCWFVVMIGGVFAVAYASTTDQQITAAVARNRFTHTSVLGHLLVCAVATVCLLMWIHESYYAFARSQSWRGTLRHVLMSKLVHKDERSSSARARAFAMLSGLMAACAIYTEKCIAEILRVGESDSMVFVLTSTVPLLMLLATAWLVTTTLESYWWHHAFLTDPSQAIPLLRPYLLVRMGVGVAKGVFFFDDIDPHLTLVAVAGFTAILSSLMRLKFEALIEPKREASQVDDAMPLLLDATESLLDVHRIPVSPFSPMRDLDLPMSPYRPPVHFRFA